MGSLLRVYLLLFRILIIFTVFIKKLNSKPTYQIASIYKPFPIPFHYYSNQKRPTGNALFFLKWSKAAKLTKTTIATLPSLNLFFCTFIVHSTYLKSTEHTLCIYFDFMLRSEWRLINIPGTMGVGPNKLLIVKG